MFYPPNLAKTIHRKTVSREFFNNIIDVNEESFHQKTLDIFQYQAKNNLMYKRWIDFLGVNVDAINDIENIPFLPVSFFKTDTVVSGNFDSQVIFESSSTTGSIPSKHFVKDIELYRQSFLAGFQQFYGSPDEWCIIGLLPSYLERKGSSLVWMVDELIKQSGHTQSGFYLDNYETLAFVLKQMEAQKQQTLLIGVTFALLDFAEQFPIKLESTTIIETGGMKGKRKEVIREDVHDFLKKQFKISAVHSEYGMTELLSQAYSSGEGIFKSVPWMKVLVREEDDPLKVNIKGRGLINVIDLANIHSCSFIATDDVGKVYADGSFEVLGRMDNSDIRGCGLMVV